MQRKRAHISPSSQFFHLSIKLNPLTLLITVDLPIAVELHLKEQHLPARCQKDVQLCKQLLIIHFSHFPQQLMLYYSLAIKPQSLYFHGSSLLVK